MKKQLRRNHKIMRSIFAEENIIDSFKLEGLLKAVKKGRELCKFLPQIDHSKEDQRILKTWMEWFTSKGNPWAVCNDVKKNNTILWKIDERLDANQIKRLQKDSSVSWFADK